MEREIILVDKPAGWTSFDVVAKLRGAIRARYTAAGERPTKRQLRVGHAGTLDPFATGLLVILCGEATKQSGEFLKLDKVYEAEFRLGQTSTTGDPEGEISTVSEQVPGIDDVRTTLTKFVGKITQTPPIYSAIKIGGQRAYKLAREGKTIDMPTREVDIYQLECLDYTYPILKVRAHVGSGTYIRSLAEDIGRTLGVGAYCQELRRISIGDILIANAVDVAVATRALALKAQA
ncbi:MAG: tRNA pseudouridine(55) synthase TruB [Candidatus Saccharimonas sp.]